MYQGEKMMIVVFPVMKKATGKANQGKSADG
jgi:hypothetical protein